MCPCGGNGRRIGLGFRGRAGMRVRIPSRAPSSFLTSDWIPLMRSFRGDMQKLLMRRGYLITQIKELQDRLAELDLTISLLRGETEPGPTPSAVPEKSPPTAGRRKNV